MNQKGLTKISFLKKSISLFVLLVLLVALKPAGLCQNPEKPPQTLRPVNEDVLKGINLLYDWKFKEAELLFQKVIADSPDRPVGYFYMAMVTWSYMSTGYWAPKTVNEYKERIDRTIDVAKGRINSNQADSYDYLYLGGALGFKGRFELMQRSWLASFLLAVDAIDALKTCLKMDPTNKEVLLGLGIFDYYTARLSGVLKFLSYLLIHRGDKEEGLRKLNVAAREAVYSSSEAKNVLLHTYLFLEEDFPSALKFAVDLSEKYKDGPRYPLLKGVCYIRLGMEPEYRQTVESLRRKGVEAGSPVETAVWVKQSIYLEAINDLYHGRYGEARSKLEVILSQQDAANDPGMIAWPLLKMGMSYDLEGNRERATRYYQQILEMENGSGAQFLAEKFLNETPKENDPFLGY